MNCLIAVVSGGFFYLSNRGQTFDDSIASSRIKQPISIQRMQDAYLQVYVYNTFRTKKALWKF